MRHRFDRLLGSTVGADALLLLPFVALLTWLLVSGLGPRWDAQVYFGPHFTLLADFARAGRLLLWDPWSNCGSPTAAYVEMGSFSPLTILVALLTGGSSIGFLLYWLGSWALAGLGLLRLGRHLGAPTGANVAVAIACSFSGVHLGTVTHVSWLHAMSFVPWMLWRLDVALTTRRWTPALQAGALVGLAGLAGHPSIIILAGLLLVLWTIGRVLTERPRLELLRSLGLLACAGSVGLLVVSPAWVTFATESRGYSDRSGALEKSIAVGQQDLEPSMLATLASPYPSVLDHFNPELWPTTFAGLTCTYLGVLLPALALLALWSRPHDRWQWWLVGIGLVSLASALGDSLPIRGWVYELVPPTRYFRHSAIFRAGLLVAITLLALAGSKELIGERATLAWRRLVVISGVLFLMALAMHGMMTSSVEHPGPHLLGSHLHVLLAWGSAFVLAFVAWRKSRFREWTPIALVLLALLDAGCSTWLMSPLTLGTRPEEPTTRSRSLDLTERGLQRAQRALNEHLAVKVPVAEAQNQLSNRFHSQRSLQALPTSWMNEDPLVAAVQGAPDRTWFSETATTVAVSDETFRAFIQRSRVLGAPPLVVHGRKEMQAGRARGETAPSEGDDARRIAELPAARRVAVEVTEYSPTRLVFTVVCPADGWLLVTDRWSRSWRARVDGAEAEVLGGCFLFRALAVTKGRHVVEMDFALPGVPWLVALSWTLLAGVAITSRWPVFVTRGPG
ncbi:MAG: hypothetical protein AAF533_25120 [Acidobacteriota bacterium]